MQVPLDNDINYIWQAKSGLTYKINKKRAALTGAMAILGCGLAPVAVSRS